MSRPRKKDVSHNKPRSRDRLYRQPAQGRCAQMGGKVIWPSRAGAKQHLRILVAKGGRGKNSAAGKLIAFHCQHEDHWHVGHATEKDWSINRKEDSE